MKRSAKLSDLTRSLSRRLFDVALLCFFTTAFASHALSGSVIKDKKAVHRFSSLRAPDGSSSAHTYRRPPASTKHHSRGIIMKRKPRTYQQILDQEAKRRIHNEYDTFFDDDL